MGISLFKQIEAGANVGQRLSVETSSFDTDVRNLLNYSGVIFLLEIHFSLEAEFLELRTFTPIFFVLHRNCSIRILK